MTDPVTEGSTLKTSDRTAFKNHRAYFPCIEPDLTEPKSRSVDLSLSLSLSPYDNQPSVAKLCAAWLHVLFLFSISLHTTHTTVMIDGILVLND